MSDERAIERLLVDYARAIDAKEFDRLDAVFLPDAALDFSELSGKKGSYAEVKGWLARRMSRFVALHHQLGNVVVSVDGDRARASAYVRAMHVYDEDGARRWFEIGGIYEDELVRTDAGFRIATRRLRHVFTTGTLPGA